MAQFPSVDAASGIWSLKKQKRAQQGSNWPFLYDPYFDYVTLLLHGDGTNGGQNNTFVDSSTNNFAITRNGNTTQGSFSPYGDLWSNYFDGTGDFFTVTNNTALNPGTGDFTFECWFYASGAVTSDSIFEGVSNGLSISFNGDKLSVAQSNVAYLITDADNFTLNQWTHIAAVRSGTTLSLFKNGVRVATGTNSTNFTANTEIRIGRTAGTQDLNGYVSNLRLVKGTAVYDPTQSTLTVPTAPLTAITNTSFLTCQSNRFVDNSANNFTITRNGDVRVTRFSPFNPTAAYSTSVIGGSGYFDGTGDYLSLATNVLPDISGAFTYECWVYPLNGTSSQMFGSWNNNTGGWGLFVSNTTSSFNGMSIFWYYGNHGTGEGARGINSNVLELNSWNHIAVVRDASNVWSFYVNGIARTTITYGIGSVTWSDSRNFTDTSNPVGIGTSNYPPKQSYITDSRLVVGTAVYTTNFTPPTAPLTPITNTSLLLNFTNAAIFDNAMMADLETVGNAQISTSVKKYGTGSLAFDGSGDSLTGLGGNVRDFGTGDFTIEGWSYLTAAGNAYRIIFAVSYPSKVVSLRYGDDGYGQKLQVCVQGNTAATVWSCAATQTSHLNQWVYLAFTRSSGICRLFVNGTLQNINSGANPSTYPVTSFTDTTNVIGTTSFSVGNDVAGYIDDLRITKGVARYTDSFTPPTAPFPNQ